MNYILNVLSSSYFHIRTLHHIRQAPIHDMTTQTLLLTIKKLQRVEISEVRVVLHFFTNAGHCSIWITLVIFVYSRMIFMLAYLTYKLLTTGQPTYLRYYTIAQ